MTCDKKSKVVWKKYNQLQLLYKTLQIWQSQYSPPNLFLLKVQKWKKSTFHKMYFYCGTSFACNITQTNFNPLIWHGMVCWVFGGNIVMVTDTLFMFLSSLSCLFFFLYLILFLAKNYFSVCLSIFLPF